MRPAIIFILFVANLWLLQVLRLPLWGSTLVLVALTNLVFIPYMLQVSATRPVDMTFVPFDPGTHDATLEQLTHLSTTAARLAPLGFRRLGELYSERTNGKLGTTVRTLLLVLENDAGTRAVATSLTIATSQRTVTRSWVELSTRFPTHVRLTSSFERRGIGGPDTTRRRAEWFPQLRDAALLARVHEALLARDDAGRPTPKPLGSLADVLNAHVREEYEHLVAAGYFSLDASRGRWVPTIKGSYALLLRTQSPFTLFWNARARRRASALLAELGLSTLETGLAA